MATETAPSSRPVGGRADKRESIIRGAMAVFAEEGYTRASIDAIAKRAGVSTRTIYNHFRDKPELFHVTIMTSTNGVGDAISALIERHFHKVTDVEADLNAFGFDLVTSKGEFSAHFAMMQQVKTEWAHVPAEAARLWREAGPRRVNNELAAKLSELDAKGLLRVENPQQAAKHLQTLVWGSLPIDFDLAATPESEIAAHVASGVRVFLYGYAAPSELPVASGSASS
ncbi:TetR/AcrR family transcriptional regulator [Stackebrandtia nassauensis]|uniref:Transcriptional regulator, TetR family n=1 Tax=Stackebrandtia nassauensis (strain DSM 44728 / CIP 108903 / NRRL B-16338 / NBRC 102104 / LLR-40K-21) TaxID=446470 RepID=D3PZG0_STANL|nr:TetR/AcrR family transcriptional regulator [Stackebrandtia nassauensis]ADD41634.1 transcriptional regulator, TetR family [Stackebrandtia nassauensis DSM 44728]